MPTVTLRPLRADDIETTLPWTGDREFCQASEWDLDLTPERHRQHWRQMIDQPRPDLIRLAVVHDDRMVGYADLAGDSPDERELGYAIGASDAWGRGLGTAAADAMVRHAFETLDLHRVTAEVHAANARSVRVLKRLGFGLVRVGDAVLYRGLSTHTLWFALARDDWEAGGPGVRHVEASETGATPLAGAPYAYVSVTRPDRSIVQVAGACPLDEHGTTVHPGDVAGQAERCLLNLDQALRSVGAGFGDITSTTVSVASSDRSDLVAAWSVVESGLAPHRPPSTLVGVAVLGYPDQLVEITATAAL